MIIKAFDSNTIDSAITKLKSYKNEIDKTIKKYIKQLTKQGYEYMISIVNVESGELKNSISWEFDELDQKGVINVGTNYSIFVEFGTGIVGANSPHPEPKDGYEYDVNSHGMAGWYYFDEKQSRIRWTKGQKASAFVYKTVKFLSKREKSDSRKPLSFKQIAPNMITSGNLL